MSRVAAILPRANSRRMKKSPAVKSRTADSCPLCRANPPTPNHETKTAIRELESGKGDRFDTFDDLLNGTLCVPNPSAD